MRIKKIQFKNDGYAFCKSKYYSAIDVLRPEEYCFTTGINRLEGEIDSGNWAVSYYLSMYCHRPKDFVLYEHPTVFVDGRLCDIKVLSDYSCYMDNELYPAFSRDMPINELIAKNIINNEDMSLEEIKELFQLSDLRFNRPICQMGNEGIRGMAAVGYSMGKQVYCFPWLSRSRLDYFAYNLIYCIETLKNLNMIVITPIGL